MNHSHTTATTHRPAHAASLSITIVTETFPPEVNGVAMTLGRLVQGLLERGHRVQVVRPRQSCESAAFSHPGFSEVLVRGIPLPTYGELRFGLPSGNRLARLWHGQRPDIVHVATEGPLGRSAVTAAHKLGLPLSSSFHTNFQTYSQYYGIGLLKTPIENYLRNLHNSTQATMVPTRALMLDLQARGYRHVSVLSRGVATEQFSPLKRSLALRESWGVGPADPVVLLVGRLAKEKNVALVISAFQAIRQQHPRAKLVLVGDGPLRQQLQASCPQAIFAGVQKHQALAMHYASSDVFLFPSLTETFGNVVPEALASGLAVLSYDKAAAGELITSGKNGALVAPGDEAAFVKAALELVGSTSLQQQYRQAAPSSVAHLGWAAIYDCFINTLTEVMERHAQPHPLAPALPGGHVVTPSSA
jgi:glycosyltransferase involved in cell wall biosynthesis